MPQVTVYIRKADLEAWKAIEKKTDFIHKALKSTEKPPVARIKHRMTIDPHKTIKPKIEALGTIQLKPSHPGFCPHGSAKGNCKQSKCNLKYRR